MLYARWLIWWCLCAWGHVSWAQSSVGAVQGSALVEVRDQARINLSPHAHLLEDTSGKLTFDDVRHAAHQARFVPHAFGDAPIHFGLTRSVVWVRLQLRVGSTESVQRLLHVGFPLLDDVTLYEQTPVGGVVQVATGDTRPYAQRPVAHRHFVFPLQLSPGTERTLYLRVASGGTVSIPLMLWQPDAFWQNDQVSLGISALYFGLLAGLLLYNLFLYFSTRESQFLVYVCFSASMGVGQLGLTGLGAQFFWTQSLWLAEYAPRASLAITALFAAIFVRGLLDTRVRFPRMDVLLKAMVGMSLLTLLAVFALPQLVSAWMINLLSLSVAVTMVGIGVCAYLQRQPGARFFLLAWSALLLGAAVLPLHNLGLLPANVFNRHGLMLGSAIEMLLLSIALADRINTAHREKEAALAQAAESDFARLEVLKASEAQLEHRVRLRTLELEEANRRLLENERLLEFRANHDALTGLANRVLLANRVQLAMQRSLRSGQGFALVALDLDGFKAVNDTHGHACGDDLLLVVAKRLGEVTRGIDTVARVGGDEFVLLLEGLTQPADLWAFASKLLAGIEAPVRLPSGVLVSVSASIGHATYPHDALEYDELMKIADAAMYTCKQSRKPQASAPAPLT